ncbi:MAG: DinB family protein [Candidatus Rokubacteria bacterium]|nr:DinB family protein [Candidatus Rokubacteria bacterium]
MSLPVPVVKLWEELQAVRARVLAEVDGLSQRQADWKPGEKDWSVGEIIDHLTIAEIATGKLTTKLTREAAAAGAPAVFPHDLTEFAALPAWPAGPAEAPPVVWPHHGKSIAELVATMKATRERSRQSIEKLAAVDPRPLTFTHLRLGDLDLAQWWTLQAQHDGIHLAQIRDVKTAPGFPRA